MFQGKKIFNASFDAYAGDYHEVRPGYPARVFEDIKEKCEIHKDSRLLEIGAGSGIATVELARFGCSVTAIEPGSNLAKIARKQTAGYNNVKIIEGTFEDFRPAEKFDAVLAFTAFHWINGTDKYQQVVEPLKDSGSLVLVWNSFFQDNSLVTDEVNLVYQKLLPETYGADSNTDNINRNVLSKLNLREQEVCRNDSLYTVFLNKYLTRYSYDDRTYRMLLNTFPKIVEIEDVKRQEFLTQVSEVIKRHGTISVPVLTTVIACKIRDKFLLAMSKD